MSPDREISHAKVAGALLSSLEMDAGRKRPVTVTPTGHGVSTTTAPATTAPAMLPTTLPTTLPTVPTTKTKPTSEAKKDLMTTTALTPSLLPAPTAKHATGNTVFSLRVAPKLTHFGVLHPRFEQFLNQKTNSLARANNNVRPLFDGQNSFAERNKLIAGAKTSINLQTFIFTDDDTGWDLARRLVERAKDGVAVRVIIDGLGSNRSDNKLFEFMRAGGVEVRAHETGLDLLSVNNRWHEKHLVVDGQVAVEGGMNIADEYSLGGSGRMVFRKEKPAMEAWRDVDVRVEGPAVADIQRAFLRNWALLGDPVPRDKVGVLFPPPKQTLGGPNVRVVQHHPHGEPPDDHTVQLYLHAINAASKSITIENAYFIPPQLLRDALIEAAKRGVEVKVLTNSKSSSDMGFVVDASRWFYDDLLAAGVKIFEKTGGTLHSKTATIDGCFNIIGSCNLNRRSDGRDTESVVAITDEDTAQKLELRFAGGLAEANEVTLDMLTRSRTAGVKVKQWALSTVAWTM